MALGLCVAAATLSSSVAQAVSAATPPADTTACPTYNAPNTLILAGGTPQSAKLGTSFADPLQVTLANTNGCPITTSLAGIAVTFTAPGSGPSGTFASSGSNAVLVGTNAAGSATASQFSANTLAGGYQVVASSDYGSVSFSLVNTASGVPATIAPLSTASQSASVSTRYAQPLQAQVLDANGNPVTGANVTFSLGSGSGGGAGGSGSGAGSAAAGFDSGQSQASGLTNSSGIATSPMFTANSLAGKFTAAATTPGVSEAASFQLHNLAGKPPLLEPVGKRRLSATVGTRYGRALQAKLTDATGAPLEGMSVTFNLGSGGGGGGGGGASGSGAGSAGASFPGGSTQATETTNASGVATSPRFDANTTAGTFTATAAVAGVTNPAEFTLDNLAGEPPAIKTLGPAKRSATVDGRYSRPLEVKLTDRKGKPLQGESVTFTLGSSGGGGAGAGGSGAGSAGASFVGGSAQATETTNASGVAISPRFEANATAGTFTATATVSGSNAAASFQLANLAGRPPIVRTVDTPRLRAAVDTRYSHPLEVKVLDGHGKPLQGQTVTFTLGTTGGGSAGAGGTGSGSAGASFPGGSTQATETTNASGVATSPRFDANTTAGTFTATAAVAGVTNPAEFTLDNLAGEPPAIKTLGPAKRSATVDGRYSRPLEVKLTDRKGKPLQGESVTFTLGSSGGGGAGAGGSGAGSAGASFVGGSAQATETTNASGVAISPRFEANATAGTFTATATVSGSNAAASFQLANLAGRPPIVRTVDTPRLRAAVDTRYSHPLEVKVLDGHGKPLQGQTVTFTLGTTGGGSAGAGGTGSGSAGASFPGGSTQATETTNASGIATSPRFEANATAGTFTATAAVSGNTATASIHLDNLAGTPYAVDAGAAATEATSVGSRFPIPLAVTVTDKYDNPVAGVLVTFTAPAGGASGTFSSSRHRPSHAVRVRTNPSGIAVAPAFSANGTTGGYIVKATVKGAGPAAFALVNQPPGL